MSEYQPCSCAPRELNLQFDFAKTYSTTNTLVRNAGIADSLCQLDAAAVTILSAQASDSPPTSVCDLFPGYKRCPGGAKKADVGDEKKSDVGIRRQLQGEDDLFRRITSIQASEFDANLDFFQTQTFGVELLDRETFVVPVNADQCNQDTFGSVIFFEGVLESGTRAVQSTLIEYDQNCGEEVVLDISDKNNEACGTEVETITPSPTTKASKAPVTKASKAPKSSNANITFNELASNQGPNSIYAGVIAGTMFLVAATLLVVAAKSMKKWSQQRRRNVGEEVVGAAPDEFEEEEPSEAQLRDVIIDGDLDIVELRQV